MSTSQSELARAVAAHFGSRFVKAMDLDAGGASLAEHLAAPARSFAARLALRRDGGGTDFLQAWRIHYAEILGPCKGGVRFHDGVSEASLTTLAARILVKCAANGLPHGGAAGGVRVDARSLSERELRALADAYVGACADLIGEDRDILSPDLGTDARVMAWMSLRFNELKRRFEPGAINGKPLAFGGVQGRPGATAVGARIVLEQLLQRRSQQLGGLSAAIQGFGAAGATLAVELAAQGVRVVAVSDSSGGLHDPAGLDVQALAEAKRAGVPLARQDVARAVAVERDRVLECAADLVIAAATGGQIGAQNAGRLNCRFVVEIANAAVSDEGEEVLAQRKIEVVPDIVVNSGGITVSHFEWVQNRTGRTLSAAQVHEDLKARMVDVAQRWLALSDERAVPLTVAAQLLAIGRIREALNP